MSDDLGAIYEASILDHSRRPRNRRVIDGARRAERRNPLCGDVVTVYVRLEGDRLAEVSFEASACALVVSAASLMTEAVTGRSTTEAAGLATRVQRMLTTPGGGATAELGPLAALAGVTRFPVRIKCAWLPWQALDAALRTRG